MFSRAKASKVKNATFPPLIEVRVSVYNDIVPCCTVLYVSPLKILECTAGTSQIDSLNIPKLVDKYLQACLKPTKHTATGKNVMLQVFQIPPFPLSPCL